MVPQYKTHQDLINQTLTNSGVLPVGEAADADTFAVVDALVDSLIAELEARDIYYIPDIDGVGIENKLFMPLANLLAWRAASAFGVAGEALALLGNNAQQGEQYLKEMDRKEIHWDGKHWRVMQSDYPIGCSITNNSTISF